MLPMKINTHTLRPIAAFTMLTAMIVTASATHAAVAISDSFTLNGTDREAGDPLNGTMTEVGGATWTAGPSDPASLYNLVFGTSGGVVSTGDTALQMSVPFSFSAYSSMGNIATISSVVNFDQGSWFAIAFNYGPVGPNFNGKVWMLVTPDGGYQIFNNGTSTFLGGGSVALNSGNNTFSFTYNESTQTLISADINGASLLSNVGIAAGAPIDTAMFFWNGSGPDNLVSSISIDVVPEPSTTAMIVAAGGALLVYGFRSRVRRLS